MTQWDPALSTIRLLDKTNATPTGTTDGGLIAGDLIGTKKMARLIIEEGDGKIPSAVLYLHMDESGQFVTTAPILNDKTAFTKYLLETKIAQTVGGSTTFSKLHRFNLSSPSVVEDKDLGWVLQVPCEHIGYEVLMENKTSLNSELLSPKDRVFDLITFYNLYVTASDILIVFTGPDIDLPDTDALKQDYFPNSPQNLHDAFQEVLDRLKEAGVAGGTFKSYYYTIEASATVTLAFKIKFEEFGKTNSNVTINSTTNVEASLQDRTVITSNKKRRNVVFVKYHPRFGSLPMEFAKFGSAFLHARFRPEWSSGSTYAKDDQVKFTHTSETPNVLRFFKALAAVGPSGSNPDVDNTNWKEDFTIIPMWSADGYYTVGEIVTRSDLFDTKHWKCTAIVGPTATPPESDPTKWTQVFTTRPIGKYTQFYSYTPWTADLPAFTRSLAGVTSPPGGYLGFALDWNYERQINDLKDYTDRFKLVTGKSVTRESNAPPTGRELFTGQRILVGTAPTGDFSGQATKIAEFVRDPITFATEWKFSDAPVSNDTIFDRATAKMKRFTGGAWTDAWTSSNNDKPSPFHIVKSARLVKSASGIPGQAIEYKFNWKDALQGGDDLNRTSRGAWLNMLYPYPVLDATSQNIGFYYGGDGTNAPVNPMVDHQNMNFDRKGNPLWERGIDSEDGGRISAHAFKIRAGFFKGTDDTVANIIYGKANISFVYARKDLNGRWFFKDFVVPENYEWIPITIQLPPFGPSNLYFNRLNELVEVFGYTLPLDFFVKEKEFSGVKYEWRKNQSWCIFIKETYNNVGMYQGCYRTVLDNIAEGLAQTVPMSIKGLEYIATGNWSALASLLIDPNSIDHVSLALDELHYVKEGYAVFPDTIPTEPRMELVHLEQESDYLTAKGKAQATYVEDQFFPNERHVGCSGNASIRYGQIITESGTRVPGGSQQSVVALDKTIIDNKGYNHELFLIRKFVI